MRYYRILCIGLITGCFAIINLDAQVEFMAPLPEPVSNNAIALAKVNGKEFIYSFGGIDSTKTPEGIHLRSYRYSIEDDNWERIDDLPDALGGKIAAAASTVNNMIYIMGGYHVENDFSETTSRKVHIYNPETNSFLTDGSDMLVRVDDHVQAVWNDSLIYTVTGWSQSSNTRSVQFYDPSNDQWTRATPVPASDDFRVFGGAGDISGNTIYYLGGAANWNGSTFPITSNYRQGIINENNPAEISWSTEASIFANFYRAGSAKIKNGEAIVWLGGSNNTYNFDGIAYDGSGGVSATSSWISWENDNRNLSIIENDLPPTMDLRGLATSKDDYVYVIGGMSENQRVTNRVYRIKTEGIWTTTENIKLSDMVIYPNPSQGELNIHFQGDYVLKIISSDGEVKLRKKCNGLEYMNLPSELKGIYFLVIVSGHNKIVRKIVIY